MKERKLNPVNPPVRVLVADDRRAHTESLMFQLHKSHLDGHVKIVHDGDKAWNFLAGEGSAGDLIAIFLDLHLFSVSGLNLLYRIKAHPQLRGIPVIVMTSTDTIEELDKCIGLGVDGFIPKPVTLTAFTKAVADAFHPTIAGL